MFSLKGKRGQKYCPVQYKANGTADNKQRQAIDLYAALTTRLQY
jgi:hypothetical protein